MPSYIETDQIKTSDGALVVSIPEIINGATGPAGPQGPQGDQGLPGTQGSVGPKGDQGDTGLQGEIGLQGLQGEAGADSTVPGPKGDTGEQGQVGVQGEQGIQGIAGSKGDTGDIGSTGSKGDQGDPGPQGYQGVQGETGSQGIQGETGVTGSQGIQGIQGIQGETGAQGAAGVSNYTISVQALTSSPTDAQTVYFGMLPKAPTTTANISKVYIRAAGTIKRAEIYCYSGTAGTNEAWSLYIRKNNTTDTLIATVSAAAGERVFSNTALNISMAANDYFEIKGIQPTWATNPLTTIYGGYIYLE